MIEKLGGIAGDKAKFCWEIAVYNKVCKGNIIYPECYT